MPRMDSIEHVDLKTLLIHLSMGRITKGDIDAALGWDRQKYGRESRKPDFPTAEHIDTLAERIDLPALCGITSGELKWRFGVVTLEQLPHLEAQVARRAAEMRDIRKLADSPTALTTRREVSRPRYNPDSPAL